VLTIWKNTILDQQGIQFLSWVSYPKPAKNKTDWFFLYPAGLVLEKRSRKTSYGSTNKFFWYPDSLVANILVIQNKANLLKFIWNAIIVARLAHICSIAETYLISTPGEAIADGVMALWITDLFYRQFKRSRILSRSKTVFSPTKKFV